jgi:hypothetical protein
MGTRWAISRLGTLFIPNPLGHLRAQRSPEGSECSTDSNPWTGTAGREPVVCARLTGCQWHFKSCLLFHLRHLCLAGGSGTLVSPELWRRGALSANCTGHPGTHQAVVLHSEVQLRRAAVHTHVSIASRRQEHPFDLSAASTKPAALPGKQS